MNNVLASEGANVTGQYLATRGEQGYVVTDLAGELPETALAKLSASPHTQWLRHFSA